MTVTEGEQRTVIYYDRSVREWAEAHNGEISMWQEEMVVFQELLTHGVVLEVGVGVGNEAEMLIRAKYGYVGVDPSIGAIRVAQERNPSGGFINRFASDIPLHDSYFDGFWAAASLLHVPKEKIDETLSEIGRVTKPLGIGFISLKEGEGEWNHETGRRFSSYGLVEFSEILRRNGFGVIRFTKRVEGDLTWLLFFVQNSPKPN